MSDLTVTIPKLSIAYRTPLTIAAAVMILSILCSTIRTLCRIVPALVEIAGISDIDTRIFIPLVDNQRGRTAVHL